MSGQKGQEKGGGGFMGVGVGGWGGGNFCSVFYCIAPGLFLLQDIAIFIVHHIILQLDIV